MKFLDFKKLEHKKIWIDAMIGMTWGFISTLVAGTIIGLLAINPDNAFELFITNIKKMLYYICPFAIGIGIGIKLQFNSLQTLAIGIAAFIIGQSQVIAKFDSGSIIWTPTKVDINYLEGTPGDVFGAFIGAIFISYFFKALTWKSMIDIIIVPIVGIILGIFGMLWITYLTSTVLVITEWIIYNSANKIHWVGILLAPIIGVLMGLALSLPTSSAAIAFAISLKGDAATAAMAGTAGQMISFGILTYIGTNKISSAIAVGFGTSMLQMPNFSRHPKLLIIPCLVSGISALIAVAGFPLDFPIRGVTTGMGSSSLYGQIFTLNENGWNNYLAYLNVLFAQIIIPIILTFVLSFLLIKYHPYIKKEWLII